MNFPHLEFISVAGPDATKFLQGQLTCDVHEIKPGYSQLGAYCNQKGRVIAVFRIFLHENIFYLLLPRSILENTLQTLKKYAVFSKVTLATSNNFALLSHDSFFNSVNFHDEKSWQKYHIEQGLPSIYPATIEMFTAHMLNLPELGAVSFNKGCYLGQEIIARTEYLGKNKRQLYSCQMTTLDYGFSAGDQLFANKMVVGNVVNIVQITDNYYKLLVVIPVDELQQDLYLKNNILKIDNEY